MKTALLGSDIELGYTAIKAAIMFAAAIIGLRLSERRVLAELNVVDVAVAVAVAVGAIVGRTTTSSTTSALTGVVALAVLLGLHRGVSVLRRTGLLTALTRRPVVLVERGVIQPHALARCGLNDRDLNRLLRQHGAPDTADVDWVLFEEQGALTIVPRGQPSTTALRGGLAEAGVDTSRGVTEATSSLTWRLDPPHTDPASGKRPAPD